MPFNTGGQDKSLKTCIACAVLRAEAILKLECTCRVLRPGQYSQQQLNYLQKCNSDKLQGIAGPFGVLVKFQFNQQQRLEMVARGKPFRMNDFMSTFEEEFGQPTFVEQSIMVPGGTLCPVPLWSLSFPEELLQFARGQLQVPVLVHRHMPTHPARSFACTVEMMLCCKIRGLANSRCVLNLCLHAYV